MENYTTSTANSQIVADPNAIGGQALAIIALDPGGNNDAAGDYTSARLVSSVGSTPNNNWKYGYMEARVKMPYGDGIWPAFWMMGNNINSGTAWPTCGEIDIMENIGNAATYNGNPADQANNHGSLHEGPSSSNVVSASNIFTLAGPQLFHNAYHTFAVNWQANEIQFYVDGNLYETDTSSSLTGATWAFNNSFFYLLNLAVGGTWPGNPDATTSFPQTMFVNYVRTYQTGKPTPTPVVQSTWRVHCGGDNYTDGNGNLWVADTNFTGGWPSYGSTAASGTVLPASGDSLLYQYQRYGNATGGETVTYAFNVPAGSTYQVDLKFDETNSTGPNQRQFNYSINGTTEATNFDIYATAGGANKALDEVYKNISPNSSGQIVIQFTQGAYGNPTVGSIQVIQTSSTATPTLTSTATFTTTSTPSRTSTPTFTFTRTYTPTFTPTYTPTDSPTSTSTVTSVNTATNTPTSSATPTPTPSDTSTGTATATHTNSSTNTATSTPTRTATLTPTNTVANTSTTTSSSTPSYSPTVTRTNSATDTTTSSPTNTTSATPTDSASETATFTVTNTLVGTATQTATATATISNTATRTTTSTPTNTLVNTATQTATSTPTDTLVFTPTNSPTSTAPNTATKTATSTATNTLVNTATQTPTETSTDTLVNTATITATSTASNTATKTTSSTPTDTRMNTATQTATPTPTNTATNTATHTNTSTVISTYTDSPTLTPITTTVSASTPTGTATPAPVPRNGVVIYPDPVTGPTVSVLPQAYSGISNVEVEIFTTAFRRVQNKTFPNVPSGVAVTVQLTDKWGTPLANGLYYLVVTVDGQRSFAKLLILS